MKENGEKSSAEKESKEKGREGGKESWGKHSRGRCGAGCRWVSCCSKWDHGRGHDYGHKHNGKGESHLLTFHFLVLVCFGVATEAQENEDFFGMVCLWGLREGCLELE